MLLFLISCESEPSKYSFTVGNRTSTETTPEESSSPSEKGILSAIWSDVMLITWEEADNDEQIKLNLHQLDSNGDPIIESIQSIDVEGTELTLELESETEYEFWVSYHNEDETQGSDRRLKQWTGENRLLYRSETPLSRAMDIWGMRLDEREIVVIGGGTNPSTSALIVDTTDPYNPETLYRLTDAGFGRDVKIFDQLLFVAADPSADNCAQCDGIGVRIYDLSEPSEPILLSTISDPTSSVHNLTYHQGFLYLASMDEQQLVIYDLREPDNPNRIADWEPNMVMPPMLLDFGIAPHDMFAQDDKLYVAHGLGFSILDISNPYNPKDLYDHFIEWGTHNIWADETGSVLYTSREIAGGPLQTWSLTESDNGLEAIELSSTATGEDRCIHNVHTKDEFIFGAWYVDGLLVFDGSDPSEPNLVGWYDTFDGYYQVLENEFNGMLMPPIVGAWGVWPYGEHIAVSDTMRGLIVFDFIPNTVVWEK